MDGLDVDTMLNVDTDEDNQDDAADSFYLPCLAFVEDACLCCKGRRSGYTNPTSKS